jgi:hypothetical protein
VRIPELPQEIIPVLTLTRDIADDFHAKYAIFYLLLFVLKLLNHLLNDFPHKEIPVLLALHRQGHSLTTMTLPSNTPSSPAASLGDIHRPLACCSLCSPRTTISQESPPLPSKHKLSSEARSATTSPAFAPGPAFPSSSAPLLP